MSEPLLLKALKGTELIIQRAAFVSLDNKWGFATKGATFSRLYFVTKGSGFLKSGNKYITMLPGNVYLIPPNCDFSCGCERLEKIFFHVLITTIERYDLLSSQKEILSIPFSPQISKDLKALIDSGDYFDIVKIKSILLDTIIKLRDSYKFQEAPIKRYSKHVEEAISFIEKHISVKLKVTDISNELFLSESKLRNSFKSEMNIPIGKYIDDMIFIKAKELLSSHESTVFSVSNELGFCDQFYFSRRFKDKTGITPSEYKKQLTLV